MVQIHDFDEDLSGIIKLAGVKKGLKGSIHFDEFEYRLKLFLD